MYHESDSLELLDLSVRSYRYCRQYGIDTIEQLIELPENVLYHNVALGSQKVYQEIVDHLADFLLNVNRSTVH